MVKVYYASFARSLRVLWTLEEMGAPYEAVAVKFPPRLAQPDFLQINPLGQIPAVVDGDVTLLESMAACEYLTDKHGGEALVVKAGEPDRAAYLQWLWFGEATLMPPIGTLVRQTLGPAANRNEQVIAEARAGVVERLAMVEKALEGREFLAGGRLTLADVSVAYALNLGVMLKLTDLYPASVAAYFERIRARPAFQRAVATA